MTVSFVSQKGGVGKSTLARLFAVGAAHRGLRPLLADFDLEQLTCVEWNAIRLQNEVEPDIDARAFKSLKKLRKNEDRAGIGGAATAAAFRCLYSRRMSRQTVDRVDIMAAAPLEFRLLATGVATDCTAAPGAASGI